MWSCLLWFLFVFCFVFLVDFDLEQKKKMHPSPDFIFVATLEWHEQIPAIMQKCATVPEIWTCSCSLDGDSMVDCVNLSLISRFPFCFPAHESEYSDTLIFPIADLELHFAVSHVSVMFFFCCDPTSWLLAALTGCSFDWRLSGWTGEHIIHHVESLPGVVNQCVMASRRCCWSLLNLLLGSWGWIHHGALQNTPGKHTVFICYTEHFHIWSSGCSNKLIRSVLSLFIQGFWLNSAWPLQSVQARKKETNYICLFDLYTVPVLPYSLLESCVWPHTDRFIYPHNQHRRQIHIPQKFTGSELNCQRLSEASLNWMPHSSQCYHVSKLSTASWVAC